MKQPPPGVVAGFRHVDAAVDAIHAVKEMGYRDFTVYTPGPNHEVADAVGHKVSPVRLWTLIGGLTGVASGFGMTLWMSYDWPLVVGGKTIGSVIPYVVIAFELMILIGALVTIAGLVFHIWRTSRPAVFDPKFTDDMIGIFVPCPPERRSAVEQLMRTSGAEEVRSEA